MHDNNLLVDKFIDFTKRNILKWKYENNFYEDAYRAGHKIGKMYFEYLFINEEYPYLIIKCWDRLTRDILYENTIRCYDDIIENKLIFLGETIKVSFYETNYR